ncbi:hypothetical protein P879_01867 [Paragonimus westermani]|uniref:Cyclic nucleotide-binding domain-containing protein n=1 Tax=Paragonimus westermani TaxID=34504 RepID=A0A8T0DUS0_9TREM|nr:hypothetical protein P879_01867 [Paragonimus westermani]
MHSLYVTPSPNNEVWSRMRKGDFFGDISALNNDGQKKQTADVRAVGYADLLVLSRQDVLDVLRDHPDAETHIMQSARKRLYSDESASRKSSSQPIKKELVNATGVTTSDSNSTSRKDRVEISVQGNFESAVQGATESLQTK